MKVHAAIRILPEHRDRYHELNNRRGRVLDGKARNEILDEIEKLETTSVCGNVSDNPDAPITARPFRVTCGTCRKRIKP